MKNFFDKFKSYGFWVSLAGAIMILIDAFGRAFGFSVENKIVEDVVMSIAGVLVVLGFVSMTSKTIEKEEDENAEDEDDKDEGEE